MNLVDNNLYTQTFRKLGEQLPEPKAILCISAHWLTEDPLVLTSEHPRQIFDFQGFPKELYEILYRPPGAPSVAKKLMDSNPSVHADTTWGLDHGTWAVLHHMYPGQDMPCFQLSLSVKFNLQEHMDLAIKLRELSQQGVLIIGSGNIVHNLRQISFDPLAPAKKWATDFENFVLETIGKQDLSLKDKLEKIFTSPDLRIAHPSIDHLLPLVYSLAAADPSSRVVIEASGIQNASISMASLQFKAET